MSEGAIINLNVYDVSGKLIHSISQGFQSEGVFRETIHLPKGKIGSGIYLLEIASDGSRVFAKLIISD